MRRLICIFILCLKAVVSFILPLSITRVSLDFHRTKLVSSEPLTASIFRSATPLDAIDNDVETNQSKVYDCRRRDLVVSLGWLLSTSIAAQPSFAADSFDDYQAPIFDGLSQQIRRSAVRGAQVIDRIDGTWERFSDDFGLGANRNMPKVDKVNVISGGSQETRNMLNEKLAYTLLHLCDMAFLNSFNNQHPQIRLSEKVLLSRIDDVKSLVKKSFFPSPGNEATSQEEYNYEIYTRFKTYNDILIEQKLSFPPFMAQFRRDMGEHLLELITPLQPAPSSSDQIQNQLQSALDITDMMGLFWVDNGFITSWERSVPSKEDVEDFVERYVAPSGDNFSTTSDLKFTLALMGDVTLQSQLLLQELGYRLYPSFERWALEQQLIACFRRNNNNSGDRDDVTIVIDDYYMDTAYNSNPDLFEVKQVLLNIVLQRV